MSTDEPNNTNEGQSRVGEAGANLTAGLDHPLGRLLTAYEVLGAIAATDDSICAACGTPWTMHRIRCEGGDVPNKPLNRLAEGQSELK